MSLSTPSVRLIHTNFGTRLTLFSHRSEKFPPLWNKEAGLCAGWCRVTRDPVIVIGILLLKDFQETLTGENVDPTSVRIVEQVVGTTCNFTRRDFLAGIRIKNEQARWHPASDQ